VLVCHRWVATLTAEIFQQKPACRHYLPGPCTTCWTEGSWGSHCLGTRHVWLLVPRDCGQELDQMARLDHQVGIIGVMDNADGNESDRFTRSRAGYGPPVPLTAKGRLWWPLRDGCNLLR